MTELTALLEQVKAATGPDRELDRAIECALFGGVPMPRDPDRVRRVDGNGYGYTQAFHCYTATVDNALALVNRTLPGWMVRIQIDGDGVCEGLMENGGDFGAIDARHTRSFAPTPALALLAALLSGLIAQRVP